MISAPAVIKEEEKAKCGEDSGQLVYGDLDDFIFMDQEYHCSDR